MKTIIAFFCVFFAIPVYSQEIVWHKWSTENFSILSIDKNQGQYLYQNLEKMKSWCLTRWGLKDIKFANECRVFCVPDKEALIQLFRVNCSSSMVKYRNDGKIELSVLWLLLDKSPAETVLNPLSLVCFSEYSQTVQPLGFWAVRGFAILNSPVGHIKKRFVQFNFKSMILSKAILEMTEEKWGKLSSEAKAHYENEAAFFCLFLRKEFGEKAVSNLLATNNIQMLGFRGFEDFDGKFRQYVPYLVFDIENNKTPDKYLKISHKE